MPNFQTKALNALSYPFSDEQISFKWVASSGNESLIFTQYKGEEFFLKQIVKDKSILVKGDKLAKPSMVKILQNALSFYQKATKSKPIYSNINPRKNRHENRSEFLKDIDFFAHEFSDFQANFKDTKVEVGFGSGRHLLFCAKQNPCELFIGVEIHKPSIEQVVKQCKLQNIKNIIIIDLDARVLMEFFKSNSIGKIYVHFPVPWDKKPHRRVISQAFLQEALRVLKQDCVLELRTDSPNYFKYSLSVMLDFLSCEVNIKKNQDIDVISKYEARWKKMQKDIYEVSFKCTKDSPLKDTPSELKFDFEVLKNNFLKQTILKDGYFVNFEKCYNINEHDYLYKVALGDTANVEHCYLFVQNKKARYFPKKLYATKNNLKAHKLIEQRLKNENSN